MADWRENLVESREGIASILAETKRIAVLGIKTEAQRGQAAFYVPEYMAEAGYEIVEGNFKEGRMEEMRRVNYAPQNDDGITSRPWRLDWRLGERRLAEGGELCQPGDHCREVVGITAFQFVQKLRTGHVPAAVHIDWRTDLQDPDPPGWAHVFLDDHPPLLTRVEQADAFEWRAR